MYKKENNYAFIDAQNLHRGILDLGWKLDWHKFRIYLKEKYLVTKAFIFIGYISHNKNLYRKLEQSGFICIFKEVVKINKNLIKGNVDTELVLRAMIELSNFDQAIIISGDGDFACLIKYLDSQNKLKVVLVPNMYKYSSVIKKTAKKKIYFLNNTQNKIGLK
jgi:uncharacterized LabA/DUF88 family protein